jgi:hypothetical protein
MKNIIIAILLFSSVRCFAGWEKTYGGSELDQGNCIIKTTDRGYCIIGTSASFGALDDIYCIRLKENGDTIWQKLYGGDDYDWGYSILQTPDNGFVITGGSRSFSGSGDWDIIAIKTDSLGNILWQLNYGDSHKDELAHSISECSDGGFIIGGYTAGNATYGDTGNVLIIRTDSLGDTIWTRRCILGDEQSSSDLIYSSENEFLILGTVLFGSADNYYPFLIKMNELGDTLWTRVYNDRDFVFGKSIAKANHGGFVIAGEYFASVNYGYLLYVDSAGVTLREKVSDSAFVTFNSIIQTDSENYAITGEITPWVYIRNAVYLLKVNAIGDIQWERTFGGGDPSSFGNSLVQTSDNGFIVTGQIGGDVYVIKTDSLGSIDWVKEIPAKPQAFSISVSPNPFNSTCEITFTNVVGERHAVPLQIEIFDLNGKIVWMHDVGFQNFEPLPKTNVIVWSPDQTIPSGVYLVRATMQDGRSAVKRVVLVR